MTQTVGIDLVHETHGLHLTEKVTRLEMRRPTGKEILACGYPFYIVTNMRTGEVSEKFDAECLIVLAATCCNVLKSSIERLDCVDINHIAMVMYGFFHTGPSQKLSSDTSKPHGGPETANSSSG